MTALASPTKRGRAKPETLKETATSIEVHRHGQFIASWPLRLWEVCGSSNGKPLWSSRERSKDELRQLRSCLGLAIQGPPEELAQRLTACAETPRDDRHRDLTLKVENPQSGIIGSSLFLAPQSDDNGRPPTPNAFRSVGTTYDIGRLQIASGNVTRFGYRILAADAVAKSDIATAASELKLGPPEIRDLVSEFCYPQPIRYRHRHALLGECTFRPLETEEHEAMRPIDRANRLFYLGQPDSVIVHRIRVSAGQLKRWRTPQHRIGACQQCVDFHRKNPILHVHYCGHFDVAFRFNEGKARRVLMDAAQYLAELRRVAPPSTPMVRARQLWFGRHSIARHLGSSAYGRSTPEGDFGNIMCGANGHKSFAADQSTIWAQGVRVWRNGNNGPEAEERDSRPGRLSE
jgi:hypothetical protein